MNDEEISLRVSGREGIMLIITGAAFVICVVLFCLYLKRNRRISSQQRPSQEPKQDAKAALLASPPAKAKANEHYVLKCKECDFTYHIPNDCSENNFRYFLDPDRVRMCCAYGQHEDPKKLIISLTVKEFFTVVTSSKSGIVLEPAIGKNIEPLHDHMISHYDPLFLDIEQYTYQTDHIYTKEPQSRTYIRFSKSRGAEIVGKLDVSRAYIPGVS